MTASTLSYQSGFGNSFESEAIPGALPVGQNSPQRAPFGLYAELLSGTAFTAPRDHNRRTWMYRRRPSAMHNASRQIDSKGWIAPPASDALVPANRLRWDPWSIPAEPADFVDGIVTIAGNGDIASHIGTAAHIYRANRSMDSRYAMNSDGELLIVPQRGALIIHTELGGLDVAPGEIVVLPRGMRWRVELREVEAYGYICENFGTPFRLPELGPIGSNGLANARDFQSPVASFEDDTDKPVRLVNKFMGRLWEVEQRHSPLDVVAWHGNLTPYKYDLSRFMALGTVTYDHPDPSIFTVLTSASDTPGVANCDFVVFPPRWLVAENTFRPPWFHRNVMSEFVGLIRGVHDAKAEGFIPGGMSLHNCMLPHGPDVTSYERAIGADLAPQRLSDTLVFMFESRHVFRPTPTAMEAEQLQRDYDTVWDGFEPSTARK
ncbi:homogentisate 1,2-dioxygenase [Paraburkholderia youngii]|uniref:homogentisate 1,2-dioxygenase n=1 Tax=Paraburkholderia youngii TaxID=2782701 RepID=UPI003D1E7CCB